MGKKFVLVAALAAMLSPLTGCSGSYKVNSYLFDEANVGGNPARGIKPIKGVLVWPFDNLATGTKAKGIESKAYWVLCDTINLHSNFAKVVIVDEDQAKDLLTQVGEKLGLKKKPKSPTDAAMIASALGELTGTEVILMSRLYEYDEDKVDKMTYTVVGGAFELIDARDKSYEKLDSFVPIRRIWRTHVKRLSKEGVFSNRDRIDDAASAMLEDVVDRMTAELNLGVDSSARQLQKKINDLNAAAEKNLKAGEFDKAVAGWNEVLKLQPDNKSAKKSIEGVEKARLAAADKAKADALKKQIDEIKAAAEEAAKADDFEGAIAEWKKILEIDKDNKEAARNIETLQKKIEARDKKAAAEAEKKAAPEKKPLVPAKPVEVPKAAETPKAESPKAEAPKPEAPKAEAPKAAETPKAEAPKAEAPKAEAPKAEAPKAEAPKAAETPKAAEAPKGAGAPKAEAPKAAEKKGGDVKPAAAATAGGDLEPLRNQAMAAFNKEDYASSRDLWKQILSKSPDDKQAKEMLETTEMLLNALK